jgi:hypothetical protein
MTEQIHGESQHIHSLLKPQIHPNVLRDVLCTQKKFSTNNSCGTNCTTLNHHFLKLKK